MSHNWGDYDVRREFVPPKAETGEWTVIPAEDATLIKLALTKTTIRLNPDQLAQLAALEEASGNRGGLPLRREPLDEARVLGGRAPASPRPLFPTDAYIASDLAEGGRLCDHGKGLVVTRISGFRLFAPRLFGLMRRTG
jgi:hypothetical protein